MKLHCYGVATITVRWRPRVVRFAVCHYAGMACGVPQWFTSHNTYARQATAIAKAQHLNKLYHGGE